MNVNYRMYYKVFLQTVPWKTSLDSKRRKLSVLIGEGSLNSNHNTEKRAASIKIVTKNSNTVIRIQAT